VGGTQAHDEITPASNTSALKQEKDLIMGPGPLARDSVTVHGATDLLSDDVEPTDEEYATLRKVPAKMPWTAVAMCIVELAERASYYGCKVGGLRDAALMARTCLPTLSAGLCLRAATARALLHRCLLARTRPPARWAWARSSRAPRPRRLPS
jgi:hypothetical protein